MVDATQNAQSRVPGRGRIYDSITDTIGAGDTFNAGVLAALDRANAFPRLALLERATLQEALSLGIRAAAVTVSRAGANPPWRHELA